MSTTPSLRQPTADLAASLEQKVDEALLAAGGEVPGLAVGVWAGGAEHVVVRGVTSVLAPVPVDETTLFQVGSTGKTVTALALLVLRERGLVDLDVPVREYVPELVMADEAAARAISLRHLLTHTGGHDGDLFEAFGGGDDCLSRFAAGMGILDQLAPLGTWSYSNAGFSLAGRVLEVVTGSTYEQAVDDLVLRPLGMHDSVFGAEASITHRVALGHETIAGQVSVARPWGMPRTSWPAGGLVSSVRDQLRYARFHLGYDGGAGGEQVVPGAVLEEMRRPHCAAGGGRAKEVGLSWLLQATPGVVAHGGSSNGQESSFVLVPDADFAITVLTNSSAGASVHVPLVKWALREVAGVAAPRRSPAVDVPREALPALAGTYRCRHAVLEVSPTEHGLALAFTPTSAATAVFPSSRPAHGNRLAVHADDSVQVTDGPLQGSRGEFVRNEAGEVRWLRLMGRLHALDRADGTGPS